MKKSDITKNHILDKLEELIGEIGSENFTLEEVAKVSDVSKGGLLYHFPSKKNLLKSMISRAVDNRFYERDNIVKSLSDTPGKYLKAHILSSCEKEGKNSKLLTAVLSTFSHYPEILEEIKEKFQNKMDIYYKDAINPAMINLILLAVDGYMLNDIIQLDRFKGSNKESLKEYMLEVCDNCYKK